MFAVPPWYCCGCYTFGDLFCSTNLVNCALVLELKLMHVCMYKHDIFNILHLLSGIATLSSKIWVAEKVSQIRESSF